MKEDSEEDVENLDLQLQLGLIQFLKCLDVSNALDQEDDE
jgi:hypothetical protein